MLCPPTLSLTFQPRKTIARAEINYWSGVSLTETTARAEKNPWSGVLVCSRRPKLLHEQRKTPDQGFLSARADRNYCTSREKPLIRGFSLLAQTETIARAEKNPWSGVSVCSRRPKLLHEQRKPPDQGFLSARADRNYCTSREKPLIRGFWLLAQTETIARAEKNPWSGVSLCSRRPKLSHVQRKTPDQGFLSARADRNYRTCIQKPLIRGFKPLIRGFLNFATLRIPYQTAKDPASTITAHRKAPNDWQKRSQPNQFNAHSYSAVLASQVMLYQYN